MEGDRKREGGVKIVFVRRHLFLSIMQLQCYFTRYFSWCPVAESTFNYRGKLMAEHPVTKQKHIVQLAKKNYL